MDKESVWGCMCVVGEVKEGLSGNRGFAWSLFRSNEIPSAFKVLHSTCQQIWKIQQWPQDWKRSIFISIPKKGNAKECSNYRTNYCVTSFYLEYFHSSNQWVRQSTSPRWFFSESLIRHGLVLPISSLIFWVFHVFLIKNVHAQWIVGWRKASEIPSQRKLKRENT